MFFNRPDFDLANAVPGTFAIAPTTGMIDALRRDYEKLRASYELMQAIGVELDVDRLLAEPSPSAWKSKFYGAFC